MPPDALDKANSQIAGTQLVIDEFVGPPLGGFLFAMAAFAPSALNVVAFLLARFVYLRLRGTYAIAAVKAGESPSGIRADIRGGVLWAMRHRMVRLLIVVGGIACVGYMIPFSYLVLYAVLYARDELGLDATGYGVLLSFSALGGAAGQLRRDQAAQADRLRVVHRRHARGRRRVVHRDLADGRRLHRGDRAGPVHRARRRLEHHGRFGARAGYPGRDDGAGRVGGRLVGLIGLAMGAGAGGLLASGLGYRVPFAIAGAVFLVAAVLCLVSIDDLREREDNETRVAASNTLSL